MTECITDRIARNLLLFVSLFVIVMLFSLGMYGISKNMFSTDEIYGVSILSVFLSTFLFAMIKSELIDSELDESEDDKNDQE